MDIDDLNLQIEELKDKLKEKKEENISKLKDGGKKTEKNI